MAQGNNRLASIASFTLFSAWLIAFPYEGQVLYSLFALRAISPSVWIIAAIVAHLCGLVCCALFVKSLEKAKKAMLLSGAVCFLGTALFFIPVSALWMASLLCVSLFAGFFISAWGYFYREYTPAGKRMGTVALTLALSAALMIFVNLCAVYVSAYLALGLCLVLLAGALYFALRLPVPAVLRETPAERVSYIQPFATLCAFVLIITINSGLMFQVILPAFSDVGLVADIYWAVPYIAAIFLVSRLPARIDKGYILYAAIAMLGFAFIAFVALDRSAWSYIAINTLLLGACGVNDLFWWSILGELLDFDKNPAKTLGIGLGANVAGVLLGKLIGSASIFSASSGACALIGMAVVCVAVVLLPPLHGQLLLVLKGNSFLAAFSELSPDAQAETVSEAARIAGLSERENEVALLLLKGWPYRLIGEKLFISESTVKTHVLSIYGKLGVHSRTELIQKFSEET